MSDELEREVLIMCNLSQGVKAEGREEGRIEGRKEGRKEGRREGRKEGICIGEIGMLVQLVQDGDLKLERAAEKAKMTAEEFKKVMEKTSNQEVWSKHYIERDSSKMSLMVHTNLQIYNYQTVSSEINR